MSTKNIVLATDEQIEHITGNLTAEVVRRLPRDQAQRIIRNGGIYQRRWQMMVDALFAEEPKSEPTGVQLLTHYSVGQWFEMKIDGNQDPMDVVTSAGHDATNWQFLGPAWPKGKRPYRCTLLNLGYVRGRDEALNKARELWPKCQLAPGQAREAFKLKFPHHSNRALLFGGNEWRDPDGYRLVTCLVDLGSGRWYSSFYWSDLGFDDDWLWAVVEQHA